MFASHVVCCADSGFCHSSFRSSTRCVCVFVCVCVCVCLIVCDVGTSAMRLPGPDLGCCATDHACAKYREIFHID